MDSIIEFYTRNSDEERLFRGAGMLEFARTKEIIQRHLPQQARTVLDIGGGTGIYSDWLGELGYEANLIDITPAHIASARARRTHISSAEVGDARKLSWKDNSADVVLLLGPLYHLTERSDRLLALQEARRVLRSGGILFAAAICRFAPLLASLVEGFFDDPAFSPVLARDLHDGQHRNTTGDPRRFTTAYFHRREELVDEIQSAALNLLELVPVEGPSWLATGSPDQFDRCWADSGRRERLLELARAVEHDPMAVALSPHMLAVALR